MSTALAKGSCVIWVNCDPGVRNDRYPMHKLVNVWCGPEKYFYCYVEFLDNSGTNSPTQCM